MLKAIDERPRPQLSGEQFLELYKNKWLRDYLIKAARAMAKKNNELFEDLLQEAWLRIDRNLSGLKLEYYAAEGYRAMRNYYMQEIRHWRLTRKARWPCEEAAVRRLGKATKRYFKKRCVKAANS